MRTKLNFLFTAIFIFAQMANATTYYVRSSGGSDSYNGTTSNTAFATLTKVFSGTPALNDGDIIDISGTFEYAVSKAISKSITIQGNDKGTAVIYGTTSLINKCFTVNPAVALTIENVTFQNYYNWDATTTKTAGVIYVNAGGGLTCRKCDFKNNQSSGGGALDIAGAGTTINLEDCYFYQNKAVNTNTYTTPSGGAINIIDAGTTASDITINRCLFESNITNSSGAAIYYRAANSSNPKLLIQNSTFVNNQQNLAAANGGAIQLDVRLTATDDIKLINNTIAYNSTLNSTTNSRPGLYIAGVAGSDYKVVLINNIFYSNMDAQAIPANRSIVNGYKFKETRNNLTDMNFGFVTQTNTGYSTGCQYSLTPLQMNISATLADNGGTTKTLAIGNNSLAVSAGYATGAPTVDQRGITRSTVDIGAYEYVTYRSKISGNWSSITSWQSSGNNSTWSDASIVPTQNVAGELSIQNGHEVIVAQAATSPSLTINSGGKLTINSGSTLNVSGNFSINSDVTNGTGTFVDQNENGGLTVSGTTNVQQYLTSSGTGTSGRNWYISSPLTAATSSIITAATGNGLVYYDGTSNWPAAPTNMEVMKGYIAVSPAQNTTINFLGGNVNTGSQSTINLPLGFNLVGNPYPSYVDFAQATKTNVTSSIWYRSKKEGAYNFHTYNVLGGVSIHDGTAIIPPMQSFWIKTTSASNTFGFTNAMRLHQDQSVVANRLKVPKLGNKQLVRLQVSNALYNDETVIYFNPDAQNIVDEYDSQKMFNNINNVPEIFTKNGTSNLVINGMNSIPYDTEIPLGFATGEANNFSITNTQMTNFDAGTKLILRDKLLNTEKDLTYGSPYTFESGVSNTTDRFSLIFRAPGATTAIDNANKLNAQVFVNAANQITIIAPEKCDYTVYNAVGQKQYENNLNSAKTTINKVFGAGVYFVELSVNGRSEIQKVVIR